MCFLFKYSKLLVLDQVSVMSIWVNTAPTHWAVSRLIRPLLYSSVYLSHMSPWNSGSSLCLTKTVDDLHLSWIRLLWQNSMDWWLKQQKVVVSLLCQSKIKVPAWAGPGEAFLCGLQTSTFSLHTHSAFPWVEGITLFIKPPILLDLSFFLSPN